MIVFITGASAGFGLALTYKFVKEGHTVIAAARRINRLNSLKKELGSKVYPLALDVSQSAQVNKKIAALPPRLRKIDLLINNAGLALGLAPAQQALQADWQTMVNTNVNGVLNCIHALLPAMVKRNHGHIINIGSVAGEFAYPGGNVYGASKAFVHQLSLNLRADLLGTAVRVSCIEPGMCSGTEFSEVRFKGNKTQAANVYQGVNALTADDIAETVFWVATLPAHVNINTISLMPVQQAFGPLALDRKNSK